MWLRRVRGALGMGLTWGLAGALLGFVMEFFDPNGEIVDIWPAVFAYPGFLGGVLFSVVLGIAARHRGFDELSVPRFAAWGALGGILVAVVPLTLVGLGLASANVSIWKITAALAIPCAAGGAIAGAGSLMLARKALDRRMIATRDPGEIGLTDSERRELPGRPE